MSNKILPRKISLIIYLENGVTFWECEACKHRNSFGYQTCSECGGTFMETLTAQVTQSLEWIGSADDYEKRLLKFFEGEIEAISSVEEMDDRKLLWYLMQTDFWKDAPMVGVDGALLDRLSDRLYPEYDGENVYSTETGWHTPDGEITYRTQEISK